LKEEIKLEKFWKIRDKDFDVKMSQNFVKGFQLGCHYSMRCKPISECFVSPLAKLFHAMSTLRKG
jgi:hypothetical protein